MPKGKAGLSERTIAGLDAGRATAALYVVIHHVSNASAWTAAMKAPFKFGQEAVIVFFLLSGFVMFANERTRASQPVGYYLRRLRRIYPPLLVAMLTSTLVAWSNGDLAAQFSVEQLTGTLAALQDIPFLKPGVIVEPYLQNEPLWSLSYELAFYLVFPLVLAAWKSSAQLTTHAVGLACCALYVSFALFPNHFSLVGAYFLLWWAGAMAANAYLAGDRDLRALGATYLWLLALCAVAFCVALAVGYENAVVYPGLPLRHFVGAAILLAIGFGAPGRWAASASMRFGALFSAAASVSYGIYVLHFPLLLQWKTASTPFGFVLACGLLVVVAAFAERTLGRLLPRAPRD